MLLALALLAACRGGHKARKNAGHPSDAPASRISATTKSSVVPTLPISDDGVAELRILDAAIAAQKSGIKHLELLLQRAAIRGELSDYTMALAESAAVVKSSPDDATAWKLRVDALARVHKFKEARAALAEYGKRIHKSFLVEPLASIEDGEGNTDAALAARATLGDGPAHVTVYAGTLAELGRYDEALALMPKATTNLRFTAPVFVNWLLFQWGRVYEQKGELAAARDFYLEAHARLPGSVETLEHLALTLIATGEPDRAKALVVGQTHPSLLALAGDPRAAEAWERYVAALPEAFADHAARYYLPTKPARALELARIDFANRPARLASRALVVEAAIAAGDAASACAVVGPLVTAPLRAHRFLAWKALSACDRKAEADRLAAELGI
jgi:tetratricopeptide (TPR) repeat protein